MRDLSDTYGAAVAALLITGAFIGGLVYWAYWATETDYGPAEVPKFSQGQIVKMKAFGHKGMVISSYCPKPYKKDRYVCRYNVRFSAIQNNTNTRIFGSDDPIDVSPVSLVNGIMEYELEAAE